MERAMRAAATHPVNQTPLKAICEKIGKPIVASRTVIERIFVALLSGGHVLLEGPPGTGKTLVANAVAKAINLPFGRIQFTVDLLPSDILGSEVFRQSDGQFEIRKGPIFTNILLADEINRAAPRVQSALLQAMQERHVSLGGTTFPLPSPFLVLATQNPIEHAGTFELPAAQLDRFMLCHRVSYPAELEEFEMVEQNLGLGLNDNGAVSTRTEFDVIHQKSDISDGDSLVAMFKAVQQVTVPRSFIEHCVRLVQKTRGNRRLEVGCGPRATIALVRASQARAYLHGRDRVGLGDLFDLAPDVLIHRMRPSLEAMAEEQTSYTLLNEIIEQFVT
jgi:MoxR-like ATPase